MRHPAALALAALLLLLAAAPAAAQRTYSPRFSLGAHAGATLSEMSFSPKVPQAFVEGFIAGVTARYIEETHVGVIAELNIEQRGWRESYKDLVDAQGQPLPFRYSRRLTYLQLPLLTHITFGPRRFKVFINAGPEFGYMIASSVSANFDWRNATAVDGYPLRRRTEQLGMDVAHRFDYGISAGLGCEWRATRRHSVTLEGRFYYGLGNIFPGAKKDVFSASRGMSVEVMLGYWFRLR